MGNKITVIREVEDLTNMTLHELVRNLKTYEINVDKRGEGNKEKNLGLKETESSESNIDYEELALISRNFKKCFKRGMNYGKNSPPAKEKTIRNHKVEDASTVIQLITTLRNVLCGELNGKRNSLKKRRANLLAKDKMKIRSKKCMLLGEYVRTCMKRMLMKFI